MARRHGLLRQAQSILFQPGLNPKKQHRTCWCHRHVRTDGAMPVLRRLDAAGARLGSIKTCGSVWACPVCSAKVAEPRRQELAEAMQKHVTAGGYAYLVTFNASFNGSALSLKTRRKRGSEKLNPDSIASGKSNFEQALIACGQMARQST